jgi:hypothetical protein
MQPAIFPTLAPDNTHLDHRCLLNEKLPPLRVVSENDTQNLAVKVGDWIQFWVWDQL